MNERKFARNVFLMVLLGLCCVVAAELLVCRAADPALYEQIVTPVRHLYHSGRAQVKNLSEEYGRWSADQAVLREELAAEQRRAAEIRRLKKAMAADQQALFLRLEGMQFATTPLLARDAERYEFTELISRNGQEYLTGGSVDVCYFNQGDAQWADKLYGLDPIRGYGCGPTALAMVVSSLTEEPSNPADMAAWAALSGYCAPGSGSYLSIVRGVAAKWGLECAPFEELTAEALTDALSDGALVVALMGPGHFTARGHFIVLRGVTLSGEVLVADPNSRDNSLSVWSPDLILSELSNSRNDGAPLWAVTRPAVL